MQKLTHAELLSRQAEVSQHRRVPVAVVLDGIRSLHNVGAIFRTADGAGIEKLWLCGITGFPPQGEIAKTALGAEKSVVWEYAKDVLKVIQDHKARGYRVVLLEQARGSVPYDQFILHGPVCLVVGNEVEGVSDEAARLADASIEIPMSGVKNSLNAAVAFGIAVFHLSRALQREGL